jgi:hypothetical protein
MKHILGSLIIFIAFASCTDNFKSINTNENAPIDVQPALLLRKVLWDFNENMAYEGFVSGGLLSQHFTAVDFNLFDRHSLLEPQFGGNPWPFIYENLRDIEILLEKSITNPTFKVYEGPSRILKAFMSMQLTDIFGDVPYVQALRGKEGILYPAYNSQSEIYLGEDGIMSNIEKGIEAIESYNGTIGLEGDIIYNGELENWIRFANSLKLKALMRISDVVDVQSQVADLYFNDNCISEQDHDAIIRFSDIEPNNFRMGNARIGDFNVYVMSLTMEEILKEYNDPRIETFFRPTSGNPSEFRGLLNGPDASNTSISIADYSLAGEVFREKTSDLKANLMTSFETLFLLAEATQRGFIETNTKALYESAVRAAFSYWNVEMPSDYLTQGKGAYDDANGLEQIITQKWIASITKGFEGWIEYRRTGYPNLKTVAASLNNDLIPVRMPYPTDEEALNTEQFNIASENTDGNSINVRTWWDIN